MNKKRLSHSIIIICVSIFLLNFIAYAGTSTLKKEDKKILKVKSLDVLKAKIGSGANEIGAIAPPEAMPEGPMSFTLGKDGEIYVLDQVNYRIQVFKNKKKIKTIPVPTETAFSDIELLPDDKIVLLDNLIKKAVYILNSEGKVISVIPVEGRLIYYAPEVTEIYCIEEGKFSGIWANMNERSVKIGSLDGTSITERISIPGKLSINGKRVIRAEIIGEATVVIHRSKEESLSQWEPEITINFSMHVYYIMGPWTDRNGNIYTLAYLEDKGKFFNKVVIFNPEGKEIERVNLFVQKAPHEIFHPVKVSPDGQIYQMAVVDKTVSVRRYEILK